MVICSDSSAVLMSVQSFTSHSRHDLLYEVLRGHNSVSMSGGPSSFGAPGKVPPPPPPRAKFTHAAPPSPTNQVNGMTMGVNTQTHYLFMPAEANSRQANRWW